jgi:mannose-1-phosphate guanylyltransferase
MSETRVVSPTAPSTVTADPAIMAGTLEEVEMEALLDTGTAMWAVVFAGGIGTRFWPLSTPRRPKQVLALVNERPLIADTVARLSPLVPADRVLVVTSADIADTLHDAIPEVPRANLLIEPRPLGTAAALACRKCRAAPVPTRCSSRCTPISRWATPTCCAMPCAAPPPWRQPTASW